MFSSPDFAVLCSGETWASPRRYGLQERETGHFLIECQAEFIFNGNVLVSANCALMKW